VVPTAHYFMGGVICDPDTQTELPGLFVAGEDAGGAHGANRLGGNGVANSTVFGGVAGEVMAKYASAQGAFREVDEAVVDAEMSNAQHPFTKPAGDLHALRDQLMDVMWDDVGVMRTADGLARGLQRVKELKSELLETGLADHNRVFNLTWHDWLNLKSLLDISEVIAEAGLWRENSRGAHYREDFPDQGELETSYFTVARRRDETLKVDRQAVEFNLVSPGESLIKDNEPEAIVEG